MKSKFPVLMKMRSCFGPDNFCAKPFTFYYSNVCLCFCSEQTSLNVKIHSRFLIDFARPYFTVLSSVSSVLFSFFLFCCCWFFFFISLQLLLDRVVNSLLHLALLYVLFNWLLLLKQQQRVALLTSDPNRSSLMKMSLRRKNTRKI